MASKIEQYSKAKAELHTAKKWVSLYGSPYLGGGGGVGRISSLSVKAEMYHQPRNGDNNYHSMPPELERVFSKEVESRFQAIADSAIAEMEARLSELANEALQEHATLLIAAGLRPPAQSA